MRRNWKTTAAGLLLIVGALCGAGSQLLMDKPVEWAAVGAAVMAGVGLLAAKDSTVKCLLPLLLVPTLVLSGCTTWTDTDGRTHWGPDFEAMKQYAPYLREGISLAREIKADMDAADAARSAIERAERQNKAAFIGACVVASVDLSRGKTWEEASASANRLLSAMGVSGSLESLAVTYLYGGPDVPEMPDDWELVLGRVLPFLEQSLAAPVNPLLGRPGTIERRGDAYAVVPTLYLEPAL